MEDILIRIKLNHLIDAYDCKYISIEKLKEFERKIEEVGKLLNGYITWLREQDGDSKGN
jgi:hypothetical protein